jgi:hypothetical protein
MLKIGEFLSKTPSSGPRYKEYAMIAILILEACCLPRLASEPVTGGAFKPDFLPSKSSSKSLVSEAPAVLWSLRKFITDSKDLSKFPLIVSTDCAGKANMLCFLQKN